MPKNVRELVLLHCYRQNLSKSRINRYLAVLKKCEQLGIDFENLKQSDVDRFFFWLMRQKLTSWTRYTDWMIFKKIVRKILKRRDINFDEYRIPKPSSNLQILTLEEIHALIRAAKTFRDKLLIFLLYESGCRIGELLSLTRGNIIFDEHGALLKVTGKTGTRVVRVVKCAEMLRVWVKTLTGEKVFDLTQRAVEKLLKSCAKRAGIKKRVYPHLFRHTRATHLARYLTDRELCLYFGWSPNSRMPAYYAHLAARDIDAKLIALSNKQKEIKLASKLCSLPTSSFSSSSSFSPFSSSSP